MANFAQSILNRRALALAAAFLAAAALTAGALIAGAANAAVQTGARAPEFKAADSNGKTVDLSQFAGKTVVLEWTNNECPFVRKHYGSGNMQSLQQQAAREGVVWLTMISSAPGKQGYVTGEEANALTKERSAAPTAVVLDPTGAIGKAYGAKTTPHMFVIDKVGMVVYQGGIDDKPTPRLSDVKTAKNYVRLALADIAAGRPVGIAAATPYGCSIKYEE